MYSADAGGGAGAAVVFFSFARVVLWLNFVVVDIVGANKRWKHNVFRQ